MCCLRFEDAVYEDLKSGLPGMGVLVATPEGQGEVVAQDSEKKLVTVALAADKRQVTVPLAQIKTVCPKEAAKAAPEEEERSRMSRPSFYLTTADLLRHRFAAHRQFVHDHRRRCARALQTAVRI